MSPEDGLKFMALFFLLGGTFWILRPVGKAIAKKIEGSAAPEGRALEQMRDELLTEVDGLRQDVAQLSERLDFTERMLAKQTSAPSRIGPEAR